MAKPNTSERSGDEKRKKKKRARDDVDHCRSSIIHVDHRLDDDRKRSLGEHGDRLDTVDSLSALTWTGEGVSPQKQRTILKVDSGGIHQQTQVQASADSKSGLTESAIREEPGHRESRKMHVKKGIQRIHHLDPEEGSNTSEFDDEDDSVTGHLDPEEASNVSEFDDEDDSVTAQPQPTAAIQFAKANRNKLACVAFADARFYISEKAATADFNVEARKEAFGKNTVGMLTDMWNESEERKQEVRNIIKKGGVDFQAVESVLDNGTTIELLLNHRIFALNSTDEVIVARKCFVDLATPRNLAAVVGPKQALDRTEKIAYVLGPSGIGKTVCALMQVSTYGWTKVELYTTLYLKVSQLTKFNWADEKVDDRLFGWIQKELKRSLKGLYGKTTKLRMKVALVLDEAGSKDLNSFFEDRDKTYSLYNLFRNMVAEGFEFRLIVCGTGITAKDLSTDIDKIRLVSWKKEDFAQVAEERFKKLEIDAVHAIYRQPILCSLTTNARSAWILLMAVSNDVFVVSKTVKHSVRGDWDERLKAGLVTIVGYVVDGYISMNAINDLSPRARRLVAAWVFYAVEQARVRNAPEPYVPAFRHLDGGYVRVANALINGTVDRGQAEVNWIDDQSSCLLSPAITIVLLHMLNVSAAIVGNCTAQEQIAALQAVRQEVLSYVLAYLQATAPNEGNAQDADASGDCFADVLDRQLSRLPLVACVSHKQTIRKA
jgi:hypothetical protein